MKGGPLSLWNLLGWVISHIQGLDSDLPVNIFPLSAPVNSCVYSLNFQPHSTPGSMKTFTAGFFVREDQQPSLTEAL